MSVSIKLGPVPNLWTTVTRVALEPTSSLPRHPGSGRLTRKTIVTYVGIAGATGGVLAVLYGLYRQDKFSGAVGWLQRWWYLMGRNLGLIGN
jgi:Ras family protein T1